MKTFLQSLAKNLKKLHKKTKKSNKKTKKGLIKFCNKAGKWLVTAGRNTQKAKKLPT